MCQCVKNRDGFGAAGDFAVRNVEVLEISEVGKTRRESSQVAVRKVEDFEVGETGKQNRVSEPVAGQVEFLN